MVNNAHRIVPSDGGMMPTSYGVGGGNYMGVQQKPMNQNGHPGYTTQMFVPMGPMQVHIPLPMMYQSAPQQQQQQQQWQHQAPPQQEEMPKANRNSKRKGAPGKVLKQDRKKSNDNVSLSSIDRDPSRKSLRSGTSTSQSSRGKGNDGSAYRSKGDDVEQQRSRLPKPGETVGNPDTPPDRRKGAAAEEDNWMSQECCSCCGIKFTYLFVVAMMCFWLATSILGWLLRFLSDSK